MEKIDEGKTEREGRLNPTASLRLPWAVMFKGNGVYVNGERHTTKGNGIYVNGERQTTNDNGFYANGETDGKGHR